MNKPYAALLAGLLVAGSCAATSAAASSEARMLYNSSIKQAAASFKLARAKCDTLAGNPKDVCIAEAKAARVYTEAYAKAQYKNTLKAYTKARVQIADANYDVDLLRCAALTGNDKDVCVKLAKSTKIAALADAKADKKVIEARADARGEKRIAEYKVAAEKCDALAGAAKDQCVSAAKSQYGE
ncbi:hypothetical protein [Janthinobacterium agaricidamnosum]|uniref:Lipoprotein n=1 Tax=Janthinobacterium agaricidamnosum NBRC 102515 = DSM 9628 TaxID=1349767 RepID=W0VAG2_9BURK|nr:hypothetical protein [Janthinobacterium agaricidamnosum]CDG84348.1 putative uncharacterized protein [Janthinobacterium agaricidamnosum NBRC 102515 = DSM 9628]